jgi:hypothetical protein
MSKQTINIGASPNDGTGTPLRTSFDYTNQNFTEIYTALGGGVALPGATTQVIFNDGGTNLAGDAGLVYNKTTDALTVAGLVTAGSATITGDLTVDTSTLKVDSTNNRVGIGTATPVAELHVIGGANFSDGTTTLRAVSSGNVAFLGTITTDPLVLRVNSIEQYRIAQLGVFTWSDGAGGTRMTLNSTGLGIGVSPVSGYKLSSGKTTGEGQFSATTGLIAGTASVPINIDYDFLGYNNELRARIRSTDISNNASNGILQFWTVLANVASQNMTLDASGRLLVGVTSAVASGSTFQNLGTARQVLTLKGNDETSYTLGIWSATTTGDNFFAYFGTEASTTVRGSVTYNRAGGLVLYNTTSDYRAKDIIGSVLNSGSLIDSLKVYVGKMKGATIERPMLIAHEVQEIAPYAVNGEKDSVDADGKPKYQQMDASALVPLLIAEIQSLRTRVQTLEAR